jgi:hypothetical protein
MPEFLAQLAAAALALVFAIAAAAKLGRPGRWREMLRGYRLPGPAARTGAVVVPALEAAVAVLVVAGRGREGAALAMALVVAFSAAILRARSVSGPRIPCGCFGGRRTLDYRTLVARNAGLALAGATVLARGGQVRALDALDLPSAGEIVPALLALLGAAALAWTLRSARTALRRWGSV